MQQRRDCWCEVPKFVTSGVMAYTEARNVVFCFGVTKQLGLGIGRKKRYTKYMYIGFGAADVTASAASPVEHTHVI